MNKPYTTVYDWINEWLPAYMTETYGPHGREVDGAPVGYSRSLADLPETLKTTPAWQAADKWLRQGVNRRALPATGLLLSGPPGTGKTSVLAALWYDSSAITTRPPAHWYSARRLVEYLKAPDQSPGHRIYLRKKLIDPELLAIDDLGTELDQEWERSLIQTVIEERHDAGRATMATTNLTRDQLIARYTFRTIDRLLERARLIPQIGESHRGRA